MGSDLIRPDCNATPSDLFCSNASNIDSPNQRMANLYSDDVVGFDDVKISESGTDHLMAQLCSSCFIQMLYTRVVSQFLPDSDHSDYLVDQLQDIGDVCSTAIPNITIRALPSYDVVPSKTLVLPSTEAATVGASATCTGQTVSAASLKRVLETESQQVEARQDSSSCDTLSIKYGVTTGDLQTLTKSDACAISGSVCFPAACTLQKVSEGSTW